MTDPTSDPSLTHERARHMARRLLHAFGVSQYDADGLRNAYVFSLIGNDLQVELYFPGALGAAPPGLAAAAREAFGAADAQVLKRYVYPLPLLQTVFLLQVTHAGADWETTE